MSETGNTSVAEVGESSSSRETQTDVTEFGAGPIVFFDGVCGFCNHSVDWILARDRQNQFRFAPLQGATAERLLETSGTTPKALKSIVLWDNGRTTRRSRAAIGILWKLGGIWCVLGTMLWLIPSPLRNLGYEVIAHYRYRFFGKMEACRMPKPGEAARFLP